METAQAVQAAPGRDFLGCLPPCLRAVQECSAPASIASLEAVAGTRGEESSSWALGFTFCFSKSFWEAATFRPRMVGIKDHLSLSMDQHRLLKLLCR